MTVRVGRRPKCWKTMPILRLRTSRNSLADIFEMLSPSRKTFPSVGSFRPLMARNIVDFPLPERPMITKISPLFTSKLLSKAPMVEPVALSTSALLLPERFISSACWARLPKTTEQFSTRMTCSRPLPLASVTVLLY
jgi:hypothetical protein